MSDEQQIERFRILWTQVLLSGKLNVCTEELKDANMLDVNILRLLFDNPKIIPKEIAEFLKIPNSTLTNVINRLGKKGLLERQLNTHDLRSLQLILTDKGKEAIKNHHNAERILIGKMFSILNDDEVESLIHICEKIIDC